MSTEQENNMDASEVVNGCVLSALALRDYKRVESFESACRMPSVITDLIQVYGLTR